jgi:hypothetical protein
MSVDYVIFALGPRTLRTQFDRAQLKLGSIVYVRFSPSEEPITISGQESDGAIPYAVQWIAPSEWYVVLAERFSVRPEFAQRIQDEIGEHISREDIDTTIRSFADRVRIDHLYKTNELGNNPLAVVHTVLERMYLCTRLQQPEVERALFAYHEPLISYLYLTCFDRLGQPANWLDFGSWLASSQHKGEREIALSEILHVADVVNAARSLHAHHASVYGVKYSFFRFLREVLPRDTYKELLDSIEIEKLRNPPGLERLPEATDAEKEAYLFKRRNDYTHKADFRPSGPGGLGRNYSIPVQEFHAEYWTSTRTSNWPALLGRVVRVGLASYLRRGAGEK